MSLSSAMPPKFRGCLVLIFYMSQLIWNGGATAIPPSNVTAGGAINKTTPSITVRDNDDSTTLLSFDVENLPLSMTTDAEDIITTESTEPFGDGAHDWSWEPVAWEWFEILQLVSAIAGILGNLLVIIVIFKRRTAGRTTDVLIGSLAISDFLTSIFIIPYPKPAMIPNTRAGLVWCLFIFPDIPLWLPVTASSYILVAISVERFIGVAYPIRFSQMVTVRRVNIAVALIWLASLISITFSFFIIEVSDFGYCTLTVPTQEGYAAVGSYWFIVRIVVPVSIMLITQSLIAYRLHRAHITMKGTMNSDTDFHLVARNRVIKLMFVVILVYIVCWTPNQVAFLGVIVGFIPWSAYIGSPLHHVLTVLGFYNSCANPLIYSAWHPEFRKAVKELFAGKTTSTAAVFTSSSRDSSKSTSRPKFRSISTINTSC